MIFTGDDCQTVKSQICIFPFNYKGTAYHECTSVDHVTTWCAYEVDSNRDLVDKKWANCDPTTCTCSSLPSCPPGWQGENCDNQSKLDEMSKLISNLFQN